MKTMQILGRAKPAGKSISLKSIRKTPVRKK
jgi:hypothetical protein